MTALHHVNVVVPIGQAEEAATFYVDVLGLRRVAKPPALAGWGGAWLDVDGRAQVHLSERAGEVHEDSHFALVVDDFDAVLARLASCGASWTEQEDLFGGRRGYTRDPAGNRIELVEMLDSTA